MRRTLCLIGFLVFGLAARAADLSWPVDIDAWQPVEVPPGERSGAHVAWFYAANYSTYEWHVFSDHGLVRAELDDARHSTPPQRPAFTPSAGEFHGTRTFARVDDGWLIGFNRGEWGGALYWFSDDGQRNYKISDHQIVQFFDYANEIRAIEGLDHMGYSQGSIIRISRSSPGATWQADTVVKLPFAPYAVSLSRTNTLLVTLSDALVSIDDDRTIMAVLKNPPWGGLYPNSSVLSADGKKLYIGMRQYVGEVDLQTFKTRLLVPSGAFLNKLSGEQERQIRSQFKG